MFQFSGFNMMFPDSGRTFQETYKCYSVSMLPGNERQDVEKGGKIIMPPSALDVLTRLNVVYPMLFKLVNHRKSRTSHAGVLEFVADEGKCYLPKWMMDNLLLDEGDILMIESVTLPVGTFSKFQPHSTDFLDITNPKAVLENALRNFACLTTGDVIAIKYNKKVYELCVLETKPGNAVTIIECDMNVEFEAPVGYKDPTPVPKKNQAEEEDPDEPMTEIIEPFKGTGTRLDGKQLKENQSDNVQIKRPLRRGIPDYEHQFGYLKFDRSGRQATKSASTDDTSTSDPFHGEGFALKKTKK